MEFRDYAAKETAALFSRLLTSQAEVSLDHLRTLREALDTVVKSVEDEATRPRADEELQELVRRLNAAASTAVRVATQKVQKESQTTIEGLTAELQTERAEVVKQTERADAADRDLDAAIEAHAQVDAARVEAEAALRRETQARERAEKDLADVRSDVDQAVAEAARAARELEAARAEITAGASTLAAARAEAEQSQRDALAALDAARRALDNEREQNEQFATMFAEAQAQAEMLRADLTEAQAQMESLRADVAREAERAEAADRDLDAAIEAHAAVDAARLEAENLTRQHAQAKTALEQAKTILERDLAEARGLLDASVAQAARSAMQVEAHVTENRMLTADLSAAQAELNAARTQREAIAGQLEASRARIQSLERNQGTHEESLRRAEAALNEAMKAEASARELAVGSDVDLARSHADVAALRADVDRIGSLMDVSLHSLDELASATSISDLLASLVRQLSVEFSRVAVFRVKGNRLEGEYQIGFDQTTDVTKLVLPLNMDSLITRAAASGVVEQLKGSELTDNSRAPFGGTPTMAMALPVAFQSETFAVVYADSDLAEREDQGYDAAAGFAKLMVRTTTVLLLRLSQELKTLTELRDYAAMLLQEAEEMYNADLQSERPADERKSRLQDTIECARQLYAQRAALEGPAAAALLDDRIAAVLEAEEGTQFARDLAAIVGTSIGDSRRTAAS